MQFRYSKPEHRFAVRQWRNLPVTADGLLYQDYLSAEEMCLILSIHRVNKTLPPMGEILSFDFPNGNVGTVTPCDIGIEETVYLYKIRMSSQKTPKTA